MTPIAEERDDPAWAREMFDPYAQACDGACVAEGWSVQLLAILATLGQKEKAADSIFLFFHNNDEICAEEREPVKYKLAIRRIAPC